MSLRFSFATVIAVALVSLPMGCGEDDGNEGTTNGAGNGSAAGAATAMSGTGSQVGSADVQAGGSAGMSTAGVQAGVSGGTSAAGTDGGGAGSMNSAGTQAGTPAAGTSGNAEMVEATFETVQFVINQAPCFGAGCHNDEQNPLSLQNDGQLYSRLTSQISDNCGDIPIVNPGNPQESALVKILKEPCGSTPRMPIGCVEGQPASCVPPEYIAAIEEWIAMGAPQP